MNKQCVEILIERLGPSILLGILSVLWCVPLWAQSQAAYAPMDPIPDVIEELPDPCDNPTIGTWGPDDERGNLNYLTADRVRENLGLIRQGRVYNLAHLLEPGQMGFSAFLDFKANLGQWPGVGASNTITNNEETLGNSTFNPNRSGVMQFEIGTQLDGFNHFTQSGVTYNCFDTRDPENHLHAEGDPGQLPKGNPGDDYVFRGHSKMGIENVGTIIARGVLIDVAGLLREGEIKAGRDPEEFPQPAYEFTPEELERALLRQGLTIDDIRPGDALLIRTGWAGRFWTSNPAAPRNERLKYLNNGQDEKFLPGGPGLGARAVQWTLNRKPVLVAADVKSIEVANPFKEPDPFHRPGHISWLNSGIYMLEDVDLEEWAVDCEQMLAGGSKDAVSPDESCYVMTLIIQTIPIRGSGGSTVAPIAVR
ncbi:MAG: cyclase family protein [Arenicellaceae bacterium]|nr:cyclase family protein [Arenicellaceae bacterium]